MKTIYVGNLSYDADETDLNELFSEYGEVHSAKLIKDHSTGRSKGFGFIEMDDEKAEQAISSLDGTDYMDRKMVVNEARPRSRD